MVFGAIAAAVLLAAACAQDQSEPPSSAQASAAAYGPPLQVAVTSNLVADWVGEVAGERVAVAALVPAGTDPHTFQPSPQDVATVADADLVLTVGLGFEASWLDKLLANAAAGDRKTVALGQAVEPVRVMDARDGALDPHFWFDPLRVKLAVSEIATRLSALDPAASDVYRDRAAEYVGKLDELHSWIQEQVASIPQERRLLVTSHDSLQYFAMRYGLEVVGAVIPGATTEREPSAKELADLIETVRKHGVPAIFAETTVSDRLARTVAQETEAQVVNGLHTGSLSAPGGGAATYIEMMRTNVREIAEALR